MKTPPFMLSVALLLLVPTISAEAKAKKKPKTPPPAVAASTDEPAAALEPYIVHIDQLLALDRNVAKPQQAMYNQASGRLAAMRASFSAKASDAAENDRPKFTAAVATCDALTQALDERTAVLGNLNASSAVQGTAKLEKGPRKDNLAQGIDGGSRAKAVGSIVERDRERAENKGARVTAARNDGAMTAMAANNWNKRSIELRKRITDSYARIK